MSRNEVFISHASIDDGFVRQLREALESSGIAVWVDSRNLRGGAKLAREVEEAIEQARQVIVVLSPNTVNSPWVRKETQKALEVEKQRKDEGFRVVPLLLPGIEPSALPLWFDEEPVGVRVEIKTGGVSEAMPSILTALGERLPDDFEPHQAVAPHPVEELILKLSDPKIETFDGKRRASATATLIYEPADLSARAVESKRFIFTAPLGPIETDDLRWYLEEYFFWPIGVFKERADRIEAQLPQWGQDLYQAALAPQVAQEALTAWRPAGNDGERRFSVFIDSGLPEGASEENQAASREAATELLSLPWELLHDGRGFLFHGKHPVRVRRRLPNYHSHPVRPTALPIRILLVSPRPEEDGRVASIDHRISAKPLVEAIESMGELAELTVLVPPTFPALEESLQKAADAEKPFDVIHFDGHGIYDTKVGLGGLCFEDPNDVGKIENRAMQLIHAEKLAEVIRDHRIPLVFLEACQTAKTEEDPTASVAAKLLEEGVTSVIAMSHSVLVETAHRFVRAFYQELALGKRVGTAMIAGQRELHRDTYRGKRMGAGELHLQDWFVPVLYQEEQDPQLITKLPPKDVQDIQARQHRLSLGEVPEPPKHHFIGRSRELLALERLLHDNDYAVVRGQGGAGKTTLAAELALWLVRTERFRRAAFVTFDPLNKKSCTDARGVQDSLGRQLLPEGDNYSVAHYGNDLKQAMQPIERALRDRATIIVLDNMESILPDQTGQSPLAAAPIEEFFELFNSLLQADERTRLLFTSRESLPAPFDHRGINLRELSREDAIALVGQVMAQEGLTPKAEDPGGDPKEIVDLVEAVNRHARALVLLAREVARSGVQATTENLHQLMGDLHKKYPDDRENSLYASVELSLRRLPPETQENIKALAMFHGGANVGVLRLMLGVDADTVNRLAGHLIAVGLAEAIDRVYLRLDPSLPSYLRREMSNAEQEELQMRWVEAMKRVIEFMYHQQFKDIDFARRLTIMDLPNIVAMLLWLRDTATPYMVVSWATRVEDLLSKLGRPDALAQATRIREQAAHRLTEWTHARFLAEQQNVNRLVERGQFQLAHNAAKHMLKQCLAAGESAYQAAPYHIATAYWMFGRVLKEAGDDEAALSQQAEAQRRFQLLADSGNTDAEYMITIVLTEIGDCLRDLGRLDEAAGAYQESIRQLEKYSDQRAVAINKAQLSLIYILQGRYAEALGIEGETIKVFERLGEPLMVAHSWHAMGFAYRETKQYEQAERAFRQSLAIKVQLKDFTGEGKSMIELGTLYSCTGRLEDSIKCYRRAADIYYKLQNQKYEGFSRSNMGIALIELKRYDEARHELHRAIECKKALGHAAELWKTWGILCDLEKATGDLKAAVEARHQAISSYLAYRRDGGQSKTAGTDFCAFAAQAIAQDDTTEFQQWLAQLSDADGIPDSGKILISKVQAILRGSRDAALSDDPNLNYDDVVELILLLEALSSR